MGAIMKDRHAFPEAAAEEDRRRFLARCGRFAIVTPPAMALLVTVTAKPDEAMASTIPGRGRPTPTPPRPRY
jgi:hypothetical protein